MFLTLARSVDKAAGTGWAKPATRLTRHRWGWWEAGRQLGHLPSTHYLAGGSSVVTPLLSPQSKTESRQKEETATLAASGLGALVIAEQAQLLQLHTKFTPLATLSPIALPCSGSWKGKEQAHTQLPPGGPAGPLKTSKDGVRGAPERSPSSLPVGHLDKLGGRHQQIQ